MKNEKNAFDLALNYLSYRNRTAQEMVNYLTQKGIPDEKIRETMEKLTDYGYIDDRAYIRSMLFSNAEGKRYGKKRLKAELEKKGIRDADLRYFEEACDAAYEENCAKAQIQKADEKYALLSEAERRKKITAYMLRRGFSYGTLTAVYPDQSDEIQRQTTPEMPSKPKEDLEKAYRKYHRLQTRKGYSGFELKQRVMRNLLSRGYAYENISEIIRENINDFE